MKQEEVPSPKNCGWKIKRINGINVTKYIYVDYKCEYNQFLSSTDANKNNINENGVPSEEICKIYETQRKITE